MAATEAAEIVSVVSQNTPWGLASSAASVLNDPSPTNIIWERETNLIPLVVPEAAVPIAFGTAAWDGSKFVADQVITPVFTPDALQSDTIEDGNGPTIPSPATDECQYFGC